MLQQAPPLQSIKTVIIIALQVRPQINVQDANRKEESITTTTTTTIIIIGNHQRPQRPDRISRLAFALLMDIVSSFFLRLSI
jgi:hypothetical protein